MASNIVVFGPTGAVASFAAHEARRRGATVHLAMRDISKPIPGLSNDLESNYRRVQADLSDPASLISAVRETKATTAFVYSIYASPDSMASSFVALKDAGIKFVVLLTSFLVKGDAGDEDNRSGFTGANARIEISLKKSGLAYVAIRPAYFNSNVLWNKSDIQKGEVGLVYPDIVFDFIAPSDIGIVCGAILAQPDLAKDCEHNAVVLCGPEIMTQRKAHEEAIAKALGKEIKVTELNEEQWLDKQSHMPRKMLEELVKSFRASSQGHDSYPEGLYKSAVENLRKYKGSEPVRLGEWVAANRDAFE